MDTWVLLAPPGTPAGPASDKGWAGLLVSSQQGCAPSAHPPNADRSMERPPPPDPRGNWACRGAEMPAKEQEQQKVRGGAELDLTGLPAGESGLQHVAGPGPGRVTSTRCDRPAVALWEPQPQELSQAKGTEWAVEPPTWGRLPGVSLATSPACTAPSAPAAQPGTGLLGAWSGLAMHPNSQWPRSLGSPCQSHLRRPS